MSDSRPSTPSTTAQPDLERAIGLGDAEATLSIIDRMSATDAVYALAALRDSERSDLLELLSPRDAAEVVAQLPEPQAVDAIGHLDAGVAADIVEELQSDERADLLNALHKPEADAIVCELEDEIAESVRRLSAYAEDSAGGLMLTEYVAFRAEATVGEFLQDLERSAERYAGFDIQYTYAIADDGRLLGVVPVRDLLLSSRGARLSEIMIADPVTVSDTDELETLTHVFREHSFLGLPVVDGEHRLVGVLGRAALEHATANETDDMYRQSQGIVGGEELRSMPLFVRSGRRLAWLSVNIVLNIIAASVIALHQDTLEAVIALAVFLPIISDMSGCSGNQAVAVSMRELTLGVTRPRDAVRVLLKEASVGLLNGVALGTLIGLAAFLWKGNAALGGVIGAALMANTVVAVCIGGTVPLLLKRLRVDPALAAGPILTTITDMCGFLLVLSMASAAMNWLV